MRYFTNLTNYIAGDWRLDFYHGACPVKAEIFKKNACPGGRGTKEACTATAFRNCLSFTNASAWEKLDISNMLNGYESNLVEGASHWATAEKYEMISSVALLLGLLLPCLISFTCSSSIIVSKPHHNRRTNGAGRIPYPAQ